jgi:signal peptidase I
VDAEWSFWRMNPNEPNPTTHPPANNGGNNPMSNIYPDSPGYHAQASSVVPAAKPENSPDHLAPYTEKPQNDHNGLRGILSTVLLLAVAPLIAFGITSYVIQSYQVDGESMETTLQNGDRLIVDKAPRTISRVSGHAYLPHRGDIIIFNQANLPDTSFGESKQLIKRVIGLPGEHVVVKNGKITVYNDSNPQGFDPDTTTGYKISAYTTNEADVILAKDQLFVCGDNRPNSEDSRYFGPINAKDIVGKLSLRLLPANKAQRF